MPLRRLPALVLVASVAAAQTDTAPPPAPAALPPEKLDAVRVSEDRYRPIAPDVPAGAQGLLGFRLGPPPDTIVHDYKMVVTATRTPQTPERVAATTLSFDAATLATLPTATIDDALRTEPSFSLFRRSDSLTANPTTQGVSLRGLGPSGTSRSLVLLDGMPLNDPFGGWIAWAEIPREAVAKVEVVPGGGASVWGNAALGGVIQVFTIQPRTTIALIDRPPQPLAVGYRGTAQASALVGDFGTRNADVVVSRPAGKGILQVMAEDFATDGFRVVAPQQRGLVDAPAWSRHRSVTARWRLPLSPTAELTASVHGYEESRGNGTPYQRNGTRKKSAAVTAVAQPANTFAWTATAYAEQQSFAQTFSSINTTRTTETPASDQFAVPATALGLGWTGTWTGKSGATTGIGADARTVHGETRENFSYSNGAYTRQRMAGGTQTFAGVFVLHQHPFNAKFRGTLGARVDDWRDTNGHRREALLASGDLLRNDAYAGQHGNEFSPSAGLIWRPVTPWRIHASAQQSFRRPTLNELYRPFRQGANVTEANPFLKTELAASGEFGVEYSVTRTVQPPEAARPRGRGGLYTSARTETWFSVGVTAFDSELHDAVSNVTIARGPGTFPLLGTLPAGGIGRQRLNLDRTRVDGLEVSARWQALTSLEIRTSYQYNDATVRRATIAPALVGKRLAEVPRHTATLLATWRAPWKLTFTPRVRWVGRQFDDDENTLRLGEAVVSDVGVTRPVAKSVELFLSAENVGNARVETARGADGIVSTGTPRLVFGGVRAKW